MKQSGCVCVSFGMESGNQRILDLIDKGTKIEYMSKTMKNFAAAGVACQLMTFTGFPTETLEEKEATLQFIRDNQAYWATGGIGSFKLTGTSIIAKKPEQFGIRLIDTEGADITRAVAFRVDEGTSQRSALSEDADASFNWTGNVFPEALSRPWAGGTDSLHTMVYYRHYGMSFFKENAPNKRLQSRPPEMTDDVIRQCIVMVGGQLVRSRFDLSTIVKNRKSFLGYVEEQLQHPAEPTYAAFRRWAARIPELEATGHGAESHWLLVPGASCVKLDKRVFGVLEAATHTPATVDEIVSSLPERIREQMFRYLKDLEAKGVISFQQAEKGILSMSS
jgi:hypothetical protein